MTVHVGYLWSGIVLAVLGVAMIVGGSLWAGREAGGSTMRGVYVGTAGTVALVAGAVFARWGFYGTGLQEADP